MPNDGVEEMGKRREKEWLTEGESCLEGPRTTKSQPTHPTKGAPSRVFQGKPKVARDLPPAAG